jgi:hypothetical protein
MKCCEYSPWANTQMLNYTGKVCRDKHSSLLSRDKLYINATESIETFHDENVHLTLFIAAVKMFESSFSVLFFYIFVRLVNSI